MNSEYQTHPTPNQTLSYAVPKISIPFKQEQALIWRPFYVFSFETEMNYLLR